jgi:hypothetical protein
MATVLSLLISHPFKYKNMYDDAVYGETLDTDIELSPAEKKLLQKIEAKRKEQREYWAAKRREEENERTNNQITQMLDYVTANPVLSKLVNHSFPNEQEKYTDLVLRGMITYMTGNPDAKLTAKDIVEYARMVGKELADLMANE